MVLAQALQFRVVIVQSILVSLMGRFPSSLLTLLSAGEVDMTAYPLALHLLVTKLGGSLPRSARRWSGAGTRTSRRRT